MSDRARRMLRRISRAPASRMPRPWSAFGAAVDVATYEFENLPVGPLRMLGEKLRPGARSLAVAQDRAVEKQFIEDCGGRVASWRQVSSLEEVRSAVEQLGLPIVLKTRRYGYDGKGQAWIRSDGDAERAWDAIAHEPAVAESGVDFRAEFSVIVARWADGRHAFWDSPDNVHREGILRRLDHPVQRLRRAPGRGSAGGGAPYCRGAQSRRRAHGRILRQRERPGRQRDRAAGSQQRPLDDRGCGHLTIRAAHPRNLRPSRPARPSSPASARRWKISSGMRWTAGPN